MKDRDTTPTEPSQLWGRMWPVVLILVLTTVAWFLLSYLALHAREAEAAQIAKGPTPVDYDKATEWATEILGLAATLAGFLGVAAAAKQGLRLDSIQRAESAEGGLIGILAGTSLLGMGGWPASAGLVALAGGVAVRLVRTPRAPGTPDDEIS